MSNSSVLPAGAAICPDARRYLEKALSCLAIGLPVASWAWTRRALDELGKATEGPKPEEEKEMENET